MSGQGENQNHEIVVKERGELRITGVTEVESFDESGVQLKTRHGDVTVEGRGHVNGNATLNSMIYVIWVKYHLVYHL